MHQDISGPWCAEVPTNHLWCLHITTWHGEQVVQFQGTPGRKPETLDSKTRIPAVAPCLPSASRNPQVWEPFELYSLNSFKGAI